MKKLGVFGASRQTQFFVDFFWIYMTKNKLIIFLLENKRLALV